MCGPIGFDCVWSIRKTARWLGANAPAHAVEHWLCRSFVCPVSCANVVRSCGRGAAGLWAWIEPSPPSIAAGNHRPRIVGPPSGTARSAAPASSNLSCPRVEVHGSAQRNAPTLVLLLLSLLLLPLTLPLPLLLLLLVLLLLLLLLFFLSNGRRERVEHQPADGRSKVESSKLNSVPRYQDPHLTRETRATQKVSLPQKNCYHARKVRQTFEAWRSG